MNWHSYGTGTSNPAQRPLPARRQAGVTHFNVPAAAGHQLRKLHYSKCNSIIEQHCGNYVDQKTVLRTMFAFASAA